jgi:hypothetical protein
MRRGFRKVNKFIANILRRRQPGGSASHKLLKEEFIVKLNAVADACYDDRFEVKQSALSLARGNPSQTQNSGRSSSPSPGMATITKNIKQRTTLFRRVYYHKYSPSIRTAKRGRASAKEGSTNHAKRSQRKKKKMLSKFTQ